MNIARIIRVEAYKRIAQKHDERIIQIMNKMKPDYKEQQLGRLKDLSFYFVLKVVSITCNGKRTISKVARTGQFNSA